VALKTDSIFILEESQTDAVATGLWLQLYSKAGREDEPLPGRCSKKKYEKLNLCLRASHYTKMQRSPPQLTAQPYNDGWSLPHGPCFDSANTALNRTMFIV
jgi:hypothetical protein